VAKRPQWLPPPEEPPAPDEPGYDFWKYANDMPLSQRAVWLAPYIAAEPTLAPWIDAFEAIDKNDDKTALMALLKSNHPLSKRARFYLANLLERHQLKKKQGARETPAYEQSETDVALAYAVGEMKDLIENEKKSFVDALAQVSESRSIPDNTLDNAYKGKRRSTRRQITGPKGRG
jgi:hypothetical protein